GGGGPGASLAHGSECRRVLGVHGGKATLLHVERAGAGRGTEEWQAEGHAGLLGSLTGIEPAAIDTAGVGSAELLPAHGVAARGGHSVCLEVAVGVDHVGGRTGLHQLAVDAATERPGGG